MEIILAILLPIQNILCLILRFSFPLGENLSLISLYFPECLKRSLWLEMDEQLP
jgi:hypothetical protein